MILKTKRHEGKMKKKRRHPLVSGNNLGTVECNHTYNYSMSANKDIVDKSRKIWEPAPHRWGVVIVTVERRMNGRSTDDERRMIGGREATGTARVRYTAFASIG